MNDLGTVLRRYARPTLADLSSRDAPVTLSDEARTSLIEDLGAISRANSRLLALPVGMLVVCFVVILVMAIVAPQQAVALSTGLGVTGVGSIFALVRLWSSKTRMELLLRLAVSMEGEALQTVIDVLANERPARHRCWLSRRSA